MRRLVALLSALVLALTGALLLAGPSAAEDPLLPPAGTITLKTGNSNSFTYAPVSGASQTQAVKNSGTVPCAATTPGFIAVTGTTASAALPGGPACFGYFGFGVGAGGSPLNLRPNTDATTGEALVLTLEGDLADLEFASFSLDIEAANAPSIATDKAEILLDVRDSTGRVLETIGLQVDASTRVPNVSLPNFRIPETAIAIPGNQLVLRPLGNIRFQLEGDTNNTGSIFKLTDIGTIPANDGKVVLDDDSGATATIINPNGDPVPYVQQQCLPVNGEDCVEFKLLGGDFYRLTVYASVPVGGAEGNSQETWDGLIDFDGTGFNTGDVSPGCTIDENLSQPQACITQFFYPDPEDGSGNPTLEVDDPDIEYRTDVWDLYLQDPKLR